MKSLFSAIFVTNVLSFASFSVSRDNTGVCFLVLSTLIKLSFEVTDFTYSPKPKAVSQLALLSAIFEASFLAKLSLKAVLFASLEASTDTLYVSLSFAVVFPTFTISPSPTTSTEPLAKSLIVVLPSSVIFVKSVLAKFVISDLSALSLIPSLFCQEVISPASKFPAFLSAFLSKSAVKFVVPAISLTLSLSRLSL